MKLKSKLIATIVSICAAIAVMGVGVWAAAGSFDVTVTNTVNFAFASLEGTVTVTGTAVEEGANTTEPTFTQQTLYENGAETAVATAGITDANWSAAFFGTPEAKSAYITKDTTAAYMEYVFTFTPVATAVEGSVAYTITDTDIPTASTSTASENLFKAYYLISGDNGATWAPISTTSLYASSSTEVQIRAILAYANPNSVSVKATGSWEFTVNMIASASLVGTTGVSNGHLAASITTTDGVVVVPDSGTTTAANLFTNLAA